MSKNCFTICIDMDDTIENLLPAWLNWLEGQYHFHIDQEDINSWDILTLFPFLTPEQIYAPLYSRDFWKRVTPKEDAIIYIQKLINDGHDVYICTASPYGTLVYKFEEILEKYFPFIDYKHIIVAYPKQMIKCDIMIDDGYHNLIGGNYLKILFEANYNRSFDEKEYNILRVHSWKEIYDTINTHDWIYSCEGKETIDY